MLAAALLTGAGTGSAAPAALTDGSLDASGPYETAGRDPGIVHLTFDDGPDQLFTPLLLDLLDGYGAKASFFPLGRNLEPRWGAEEVQALLSRSWTSSPPQRGSRFRPRGKKEAFAP